MWLSILLIVGVSSPLWGFALLSWWASRHDRKLFTKLSSLQTMPERLESALPIIRDAYNILSDQHPSYARNPRENIATRDLPDTLRELVLTLRAANVSEDGIQRCWKEISPLCLSIVMLTLRLARYPAIQYTVQIDESGKRTRTPEVSDEFKYTHYLIEDAYDNIKKVCKQADDRCTQYVAQVGEDSNRTVDAVLTNELTEKKVKALDLRTI